jgi:hypothetical protein
MQQHPSRLVTLESGTFALFDPLALEHRRTDGPKWTRDSAAVGRELASGNLAAIDLGEKATFRVRFGPPPQGAPRVGPLPLRVPGGRIYLGDVQDAPSRRWGRHRFGIWDVLLAVFVLALVPTMFWFASLDRFLLLFTVSGTIVTVLAMIPITWLFFRKGIGEREFALNTGTPLGDHPESVLELPPGDWAVTVSRPDPERPLLYVDLQAAVPSQAATTVPSLAVA